MQRGNSPHPSESLSWDRATPSLGLLRMRVRNGTSAQSEIIRLALHNPGTVLPHEKGQRPGRDAAARCEANIERLRVLHGPGMSGPSALGAFSGNKWAGGA